MEDLKKELELNKKLLAQQCDLAREAETELEVLRNKVKEYFRAKIAYLQIADGWGADRLDVAERELRIEAEKDLTAPA